MSELDVYMQANEALHNVAYQPGPNLCTELEKVFDEVFEYKKSLGDAPKTDKCKMVVNYVKNTAGKKMLTVIQQYTGLTLDLHLFKQFTCNFGVIWHFSKDLTLKDWATVVVAAMRYSGALANEVYKEYAAKYKNIKSQEELEQISREVMKDKGAVTKAMYEKHNLHGSLYFCPYTAFLVQEVYKANIEPLTSKELAAIIAHECGHVIAFLIHMIDICYKKDILYTGAKNYFMTAPSEIQKRIALSTAKKYFPEKVQKIMDKLEDFKGKTNKQNYEFIHEAIYAVWLLLVRIITGLFGFAIQVVEEVFRVTIIGPIEHVESYDKNKASDFYHKTNIGGYYDEELADEYVSKMGYTSPLAHALDKIEKWIRYTGGYTDAVGASLYIRLLPWMAASLFRGYREDFVHPAIFQREENAIMDLIKAFKSANCPQELLDEYYKAYREVKALSESNTFDRKWMAANKAISRAIDYLVDTPYSMLYSGRFQQEYEMVFRQVQQLMNNQLYALSYGLSKPKDNK